MFTLFFFVVGGLFFFSFIQLVFFCRRIHPLVALVPFSSGAAVAAAAATKRRGKPVPPAVPEREGEEDGRNGERKVEILDEKGESFRIGDIKEEKLQELLDFLEPFVLASRQLE